MQVCKKQIGMKINYTNYTRTPHSMAFEPLNGKGKKRWGKVQLHHLKASPGNWETMKGSELVKDALQNFLFFFTKLLFLQFLFFFSHYQAMDRKNTDSSNTGLLCCNLLLFESGLSSQTWADLSMQQLTWFSKTHHVQLMFKHVLGEHHLQPVTGELADCTETMLVIPSPHNRLTELCNSSSIPVCQFTFAPFGCLKLSRWQYEP